MLHSVPYKPTSFNLKGLPEVPTSFQPGVDMKELAVNSELPRHVGAETPPPPHRVPPHGCEVLNGPNAVKMKCSVFKTLGILKSSLLFLQCNLL